MPDRLIIEVTGLKIPAASCGECSRRLVQPTALQSDSIF